MFKTFPEIPIAQLWIHKIFPSDSE